MTQPWNPEAYRERAGYVPALGQPLLDLLNPRPWERILDLGCGDGELTARIQEIAPAVLGIDASEQMVEAARRRGVDAVVADGQRLSFDGEFDAVFSNAALHWMKDATAVVSGVRRALAPGGRFVAECGGYGNIARIVAAIEQVTKEHPEYARFENPWYFPRPDEYRRPLEQHGFHVELLEHFDRPTPLEHGVRGWLEVFARHVTDAVAIPLRERFLDACEARLRDELYDPDRGWWADYVRLRVRATLPPPPAERRHRAVARALTSAIGQGVYEPGERLPSVRDLASPFDVGVNTVREAIARLEDCGLVQARERSGLYVAATPLVPDQHDSVEDALLSLVPEGEATRRAPPAVVHLDRDWMPDEFVPTALLSRALRSEARAVSSLTTGYVTLEKSEPLRAFIAQRIFAAGATVTASDVVLTDGITNGIARALRFHHSGEGSIAVESPTHFTLRRILDSLGFRLVPVPVDHDGVRVDLLEEAMRSEGVTTLLTTPNFHNPTGVVLSADRRRAIAALADHRGLLVIEDDVHRETSFAAHLPPPILGFASGGNVLLCSNFAEVLTPSLKVGWLATHGDASGFHDYVRTTTCTVPGLSVAVLQHIAGSGGYERHRRRLARRIAAALGQARADILRAFSDDTQVSEPSGGYSLWVRLPQSISATRLFLEARRKAIGIVPGSVFGPPPSWEHFIRLSPGAYDADQAAAVAMLGELACMLDRGARSAKP